MDECFEVDFILDSKPGMIQDDLGWFSEHVHSITVLQSWSTMNLALLLNIHLIPSQFLQMLGYSLISQLTTITANQDSTFSTLSTSSLPLQVPGHVMGL